MCYWIENISFSVYSYDFYENLGWSTKGKYGIYIV